MVKMQWAQQELIYDVVLDKASADWPTQTYHTVFIVDWPHQIQLWNDVLAC